MRVLDWPTAETSSSSAGAGRGAMRVALFVLAFCGLLLLVNCRQWFWYHDFQVFYPNRAPFDALLQPLIYGRVRRILG